jgi:hypothetical protein
MEIKYSVIRVCQCNAAKSVHMYCNGKWHPSLPAGAPMTPESESSLMIKAMREAMEPQGHIVHWYDLLALMIVGYWLGTWLNQLWFL